MSEDVEMAGAIALGGFFRRGNHAETLPLGTPCPNCATRLEGKWCHACGQFGEDFHRSARKLLSESLSEFLDLDNRLWTTLPDLVVRPGRLTRSYLDGHRVPQVPPLRLFLVVLVVLFLVGLNIGSHTPPNILVPGNKADAIKQIEASKTIAPEDKRDLENTISEEYGNRKPDALAVWFTSRIKNAIAHQSEFWQAIQNWAERFAILMLPVSALLLSLLFVTHRRFFIFDHIVFSMHSLSFMCLLLTAAFLWDHYMPFKLSGWVAIVAPLHLFAHMRGVYGTSIVGTLLRMAFLFVGSAIGAAFILLGLLWVALATV